MSPRRLSTFSLVALLGTTAALVLASGLGIDRNGARGTTHFGADRLIAWEPLPQLDGSICELVPVSAAEEELFAMQAPGRATSPARASAGGAPPRPSDALRDAVAKRPPATNVGDPSFVYSGIAVDPVRNEVIMSEENLSKIVVYDRLTNTPPNAAMSEPKRILGGEESFLEYTCAVYVDPGSGDIYAVNNDTMNWMPVFGRNQEGNAVPKRKLRTPHTTFGIVADEVENEIFFAVQDEHAVVVFPKDAKEEDLAKRVLQGPKTRMADPHGLALDPKKNELFVTNWGSSDKRPAFTPGNGGGAWIGAGRTRKDFPVGALRATPASGKIDLPSVTVYPKGSMGDTAPLRVIQGPKTQLDWPTAIAVHPDRGEIYVANDTNHTITIYPADANGDVAPIRVIKGPKSMVKNPTGVAIDFVNNELWVANFGNHSATVYALDAGGDAAPKRVIRSAPTTQEAPMLANPHTVAFDSKRDEILVSN
jgi:DNA-binding beta-propeller fold protein YncE